MHILPVLGERRLSSIRKSDIKKFEADLIVAGKGTATVGGCHRLLRRIFEVAVDEGRLPQNPVHGVKVPRGRRREPRFLDKEELRWASDRRSIRTPHPQPRSEGRRPPRDGELRRGQRPEGARGTEDGALRALCRPSCRTRAILRQHVAEFSAPLDPDSLVFPNERGGPVLQSSFRKVSQAAARRVGVDPVPRVHDMRHSAASFMAAGYSLVEAGAQLGHGAVAMTSTYSHVFKSSRQQKVVALDLFLTGEA